MDQTQNDEEQGRSGSFQALAVIGISVGCILGAWLLVKILELII